MARPLKCRQVNGSPPADYFKPRVIPLAQLDELILTIDEFEAVRLADFEELYQEEAAKKMAVSRQTFGNIISSARKKIADALVNGKAIRIDGGEYRLKRLKRLQCRDCGHEWQPACGAEDRETCGTCNSSNIATVYREI